MQAYSVSDSGVIVGIGAYDRPNDVDENGDSVTSTSTNGFVFDINSESLTIVEPISLLEQADLELKDVNDAGLAIGWSSIEVEDSLITKAIYLDINNPTQINSIDPFVEGVSEAVAVNNDGVMVGSALHQDERYFTAFAYNTNDNSAIDLGSLNPGFIETALGFRIFNISKAEDVNSLGGGDFQVVGSSVVAYRQAAIYHAFLYENGEMKDLNELIDCPAGATERDWVLAEATAINDQGVIIGNGVNNGEYKSFMLVPKAAGATPVACVEEEEEEDSGSGSFPIFAFLLLPLALIRKKLFV